jgi:hypothetical protein
LKDILDHKNNLLGKLALPPAELTSKLQVLNELERLSNKDLQNLYSAKLHIKKKSIDDPEFAE